LEPFFLPTSLILSSASLSDPQASDSCLKKLKQITETRIARILLEPKIFELVVNIIGQDRFSQKIKGAVLVGFANACKTFKAKMFVIKNLMPMLSESIRCYQQDIE
jgi:hypothetical protein